MTLMVSWAIELYSYFSPAMPDGFNDVQERNNNEVRKPSRVQLYFLQVAKQQLYLVRMHFRFLLLVLMMLPLNRFS